jgi:outer membrane protein TolC
VAERRLRLIIGAAINDGRLIRPVTDPEPVEVAMSWDELTAASLTQRAELVQQRLRVKREGLELKASENFLKPDLDVVGRYRFRGFGDKLYNPRFTLPLGAGLPQNVDSDKNEWQIGMELDMPLGFRQGHVGVRNAQLALARERAVLVEMERQIIHDVSNAVAEKTRAYQMVQTAYNRRTSAFQQYKYLSDQVLQESSRGIDFNLLLDSERRLADAESDYHRAVVGYAVALKNVYVETGSLMEYCNVHYSDGETVSKRPKAGS